MSSRITHTESSNIHPFAYILETFNLIFSMRPFYNLSRPHHVTPFQPSPGGINKTEKPRRWGKVVEREMGGATVVLPYTGHQMLNFTLI